MCHIAHEKNITSARAQIIPSFALSKFILDFRASRFPPRYCIQPNDDSALRNARRIMLQERNFISYNFSAPRFAAKQNEIKSRIFGMKRARIGH